METQERHRLTVGDGFRLAAGFWLFHLFIAAIVAVGGGIALGIAWSFLPPH